MVKKKCKPSLPDFILAVAVQRKPNLCIIRALYTTLERPLIIAVCVACRPSLTTTISLCTLSSEQTNASKHCALQQLSIERLSCHAEGNGHVPLDCMINHNLVFACFLFFLTHSASNFVPVSLFLGDTLVCCFLKTMVKLNNLQLLQ